MCNFSKGAYDKISKTCMYLTLITPKWFPLRSLKTVVFALIQRLSHLIYAKLANQQILLKLFLNFLRWH